MRIAAQTVCSTFEKYEGQTFAAVYMKDQSYVE